MTNTLLRAGALGCALLTTTCLTAPAAAQVNQSAPPAHRGLDENGVDLIDGSFPFTLVEGTIGSGQAMLAVTRTGGSAFGTSNWQNIYAFQSISGSTTTVDVILGDRSERFTSTSGGAFVTAEGNGSTLSGGNHADFTYTDAGGVTITFGAPAEDQAGASNLCSHSGANQNGCYALALGVTQPNAAQTSFGWDVHSNCSTIFNPDGSLDCTHSWRLDTVSNSFGYAIGFAYVSNTVPSQQNPSGDWFKRSSATLSNAAVSGASRTISYNYVSSGVTEITDSGGRTWRLTTSGGITGVRRPGSSSDDISVTYSNGAVSSVTRDGVTTNYSRVVSGSTATTTITYVDGDAGTTDPQSVVVADLSKGRITSITDPLSRQTSFQYDANARLTQVTQPEGNYAQYTYDARGNVTEARSFAKSGSELPDMFSTASFAASCTNVVTCNQPESVTDVRGNTTDFTYDATHGGVLTVTAPAPTSGATRPQTRYSYTLTNGEYQLTGVSACAAGSAPSCVDTSNETRIVLGYDANGNVTSVIQRSGNTTGSGAVSASSAMTYDGFGDMLTVDGPLAGTADTTRYRYNASRQAIGVISPDPDGTGSLKHRAVRVTYRTDGLPTEVEQGTVNSQSDTDWAAFATLEKVQTEYDPNDRPVVQRLVAGSTTYALTQTGYDGLGRVRCVAQRMNPNEFATSALPSDVCAVDTEGSFGPDRVARTTYDDAGQVVRVETGVDTTAVADEVRAAYTDNGLVSHVLDAATNRTSYEYDGHDRLVSTSFPVVTVGADESSTSDNEQLTYETLAGGTRASPLVADRLLRGGTQSIGFSYDALGRVTEVDRPGSEPTISYVYDQFGRQFDVSTPAQTVSFRYDAIGRPIVQAGPHGSMSSTWDAAGRRTRLAWPDGFFVDYDYNIAGDMTAIRENGATSGTGVLVTLAHDDSGRRTSLTRSNGNVTSYGYDPVSRLSGLSHDNGNGTTHDLTLAFGYNPASQIVSTSRSNDAYAFTGHANLNRSDTHDGLNRIVETGGTNVGHDARGNITSVGTATYNYSSENLLNGTGSGTSLVYDPLNRLYEFAGGSGTARFAYDGSTIATEHNASGDMIRRHIPGPGIDEPLVTYEGSTTSDRRFLHADERGSIIAQSNFFGDGHVIAVNRYDEYGTPQSTNSGRFGYTGQAWLPEAGLHYYRARMYNPSLGRFVQTDPIGYDGGMNLYAYVGNDPVNYTDPLGLDACPPGTIALYQPDTDPANDTGAAVHRICIDMPVFDDPGGVGGAFEGALLPQPDRCERMVTDNPGRALRQFEYDPRQALAASAVAFIKHHPGQTQRSQFGGDIRTPVAIFNAVRVITSGSFAVPASSGPGLGRRVRVTGATGMIVGRDIFSGGRQTQYLTAIFQILTPAIPARNALPQANLVTAYPGCPPR